MDDVFFIYHFRDGFYWLLADLSLEQKRIEWQRFSPFIFSDLESANYASDIIRYAIPDLNFFVARLSLLPDFIKSNMEVSLLDG